MTTQPNSNAYSVDVLMEQARVLAANYRRTTGKTLAGVSGELAVYDAMRLLKLKPAAENLSYEAVGTEDSGNLANDKIQINTSALGQNSSKKVLILNSYHQGHPWTDNVTKGILDEFAKHDIGVEIHIENLDTKRIIEKSLHEQFTKVYEACLRMKTNCQGFNVAEELCMFVNFLKNDINSLRSPAVIKKATKFVENLEKLANDLQDDDSLMSLNEHPSILVVNPAKSPPVAAKRKTINNNSMATGTANVNNTNSNYHQRQSSKATQQCTTSLVVSKMKTVEYYLKKIY